MNAETKHSGPLDVLAVLQHIADGEGDAELLAVHVLAAVSELIDALALADAYLMGEPSPRDLNGADIADIVKAALANFGGAK